MALDENASPMRCVCALSVILLTGCGGSTTTVIQATTTTATVTETTSATVTTPAPIPDPDPTKMVACLDFKCTQDGHIVDFKYGDASGANVGDVCGLNGTWQDAGTDPKTGAGLYRCKEGPAP